MSVFEDWMGAISNGDSLPAWRNKGPLAGANGFVAPKPVKESEPVPRTSYKAPDGFEFTGEFRYPKNEWFLDGTRALYAVSIERAYPILRKVGQSPYWVPSLTENTPVQPTPPLGWSALGRRAIPDGGTFMLSGDTQIWKKGVGGSTFYAWAVEPSIKKPDVAPWFTLTDQYRVPKPGDWFLAKGFGPVARTNEPVKLGENDPEVSGPRWILEFHKP